MYYLHQKKMRKGAVDLLARVHELERVNAQLTASSKKADANAAASELKNQQLGDRLTARETRLMEQAEECDESGPEDVEGKRRTTKMRLQ